MALPQPDANGVAQQAESNLSKTKKLLVTMKKADMGDGKDIAIALADAIIAPREFGTILPDRVTNKPTVDYDVKRDGDKLTIEFKATEAAEPEKAQWLVNSAVIQATHALAALPRTGPASGIESDWAPLDMTVEDGKISFSEAKLLSAITALDVRPTPSLQSARDHANELDFAHELAARDYQGPTVVPDPKKTVAKDVSHLLSSPNDPTPGFTSPPVTGEEIARSIRIYAEGSRVAQPGQPFAPEPGYEIPKHISLAQMSNPIPTVTDMVRHETVEAPRFREELGLENPLEEFRDVEGKNNAANAKLDAAVKYIVQDGAERPHHPHDAAIRKEHADAINTDGYAKNHAEILAKAESLANRGVTKRLTASAPKQHWADPELTDGTPSVPRR